MMPPNMSAFNRATPELINQEVSPEEQQKKANEEFKRIQERVRNLSGHGKNLHDKAVKNRELRNMQVDNEQERRRGNFKQDEIYIPYKVINDNIAKESPSYIKFVIGSRNAAIFKNKKSPVVKSYELLERQFTMAVRYEGYEQDIFGLIDGFMLHGTDFLEVQYNEDKPGYFSFEHLGYENVWYPSKVQRGKFQLSPIVVRNCELTKDELLKFQGVNTEQVELLFKDAPENNPEKEFACVQKVYYRVQGIVHVCWLSYDKGTDFLRAPKPLHLGRWKIIKDEATGMEVTRTMVFEEFYPLVPFPYSMTENRALCETLGRASMDENTQEAVSSIVSSIVNGYHRASQVMWSPKNPTSSANIAALDLVLEGGRGLNQPVEFFAPPYPDAEGMQIVNSLITQNKAETAQINFAVGNRSDYASRKTAEEIKVASSTAAELTTTQVVLFSSAWREAMNMAWLIMRSQIELGIIQLEGLDMSFLNEELMVIAAGEQEVVQRQETLMNLQNIWPIIGTTPAAQAVLEDILKLMVPSSADKYIAALQGGDPRLLAQALASIITAIVQAHPEVIPPENYTQLNQLLAQADNMAKAMETGENEEPGAERAEDTNEVNS